MIVGQILLGAALCAFGIAEFIFCNRSRGDVGYLTRIAYANPVVRRRLLRGRENLDQVISRSRVTLGVLMSFYAILAVLGIFGSSAVCSRSPSHSRSRCSS
jgi:hypothetical protein